jgi:hypothetical protein
MTHRPLEKLTVILGWKEGAPVIQVARARNPLGGWLVVFYCGFCRREHIHGADNAPHSGDGHRVAHCGTTQGPAFSPLSPWHKSGYYIVEEDDPRPEIVSLLGGVSVWRRLRN